MALTLVLAGTANRLRVGRKTWLGQKLSLLWLVRRLANGSASVEISVSRADDSDTAELEIESGLE